ncbi:hypothetical protein WMR50_006640 [Pseudomonas aeruginosa]|uniref:hypothetical protein n=1 Tax=Pseudomonas aeruginosa TaxID=287 RepID=UPI0025C947BA|nr:hypothetical protein [Pseudomonas aeruginosa]EKH5750277.1 hypothetical protein [Pseudomonas aeruginosa]EKW9803312.1 hypothetical protein [Pseudomonas aeruginosa]ELN4321942.1 hypothetical protein [Pseudomonas aeruginosa]ELN4394752.1 hypothetical protein [Pseudomonas aeruginosa]
MAAGDYYSCDVCGSKCFYDANLNYERPDKNGNDSWGHPIQAEEMMLGKNCKLDYCGDMAALCRDCLVTHEIVVREKSKD